MSLPSDSYPTMSIRFEEALVEMVSKIASNKLKVSKSLYQKVVDFIKSLFGKNSFTVSDLSANTTIESLASLMASKKFNDGVYTVEQSEKSLISRAAFEVVNSIKDLDKTLNSRIIALQNRVGIKVKCN